MAAKQLKILIVEDDFAGRRILELFMKPYATSQLAANGEEGLKMFKEAFDKKEPFDLIFLDNIMPGIHGLEVLKNIREYECQHMPGKEGVQVVVLTGEVNAEKIDSAKYLGVSSYLLKPVEEQKLMRELQRLRCIQDPDDQWS